MNAGLNEPPPSPSRGIAGCAESQENNDSEPIKLDELPTELLEEIFKSLDGISLACVSATCKRFKALISYSEEARINFWRDMCWRDLDKEEWLDVGCNYWIGLWRPSQYNDPAVPWKKIYCRAMMVQLLAGWPAGIVHNIPQEERDEFTCLEVVGPYIITGSKRGNVLLWDTEGLLCGLTSHSGKVKSIAVTVTENETNHQLQYEVLSLSSDKFIHSVTLSGEMGVRHSSQVKRVPFDFLTSSRGKITGWCDYGTNHISSVLHLKDGFQTPRICKSDQIRCSGRIMTVAVFSNKVKIVTQNEGTFTYSNEESRWSKCFLGGVDASVRQAYIWPREITFCITFSYKVLISFGKISFLHDWSMHRPTCAVLHGKLLAVGSASGKVLFFIINKETDVMHVDPWNSVKACYVADEAIMSLKVLEANEGHVRPQIIAATRTSLHCISF